MKVRCDEGGDIWWNGEMVQNGGASPLHSRYRVEAANEADLSMVVYMDMDKEQVVHSMDSVSCAQCEGVCTCALPTCIPLTPCDGPSNLRITSGLMVPQVLGLSWYAVLWYGMVG